MPDLAVAELSIPAEQNPDPHPLSSVLEYTIGREEAAKYSWHSFRIGLACALRAAGCPPDVVQLICRWNCAESLRIYSLKGISEHAHWISCAENAPVDAVRGAVFKLYRYETGIW